MKPLDEVIKAIEVCRDSYVAGKIIKSDALHYLKMYRSDMQMYSENQKYWEDELKQKIKDFGDAKERYIKRLKELDIGTLNEPLTWDELRTMEGKPVWVVEEGYQTWEYWSLVYWMKDDELTLLNENGQMTYSKNEQGTVWQAYRKERA